ncbi:MAG: pitrilysin family protein [Acidobacteriota bacterium]
MRSGTVKAACLILLLAASAAAQIPKHPSELSYPLLDYTPPKAASCRHVLSNGVVGYFVEDHALPLVNISMVIRAGSYLDAAGKEGLAAAVGSQIRAGGTTRLSAEQFDEEVDFLAANITSGIGDTSGSASVNFLSKDTEQALELFFEILRSPGFQQDRMDLYRSQALQQIERRNDQTGSIEAREWRRLLYGEKHFTNRWSTKASISAVTREDLIAFHGRYYHPGNIILAVSGDFQTADMKARLEKAMAGWPPGTAEIPPVPKPDHTPGPGIFMVHKADVNQARVSMGHLGIVRGNPDEFAVDLMNDILGGSSFTSRITNRVRSDEGLAYDAGSSFTAGVYYEGQFAASFQTKSATVAQAARIVLDEINRIRAEKVGAGELETVKNYAVEIFPRFFSSAAAVAGTFANDEFTGRDPGYWETYREKIRAVTVDDIQRVARVYLHPDRLVVLVVGNVDDVLKGNPDKSEFSFDALGLGKVTRIPLPDPATMIYPK